MAKKPKKRSRKIVRSLRTNPTSEVHVLDSERKKKGKAVVWRPAGPEAMSRRPHC